ncbi:hypothetical protein IMPR6_20077 [Imperialibacter sp. EC-SDR9]|nr:hypothetical protein IMPR6_20077 [Imperialibacter sp. EC-SDR9]
MSAGVGIKKKSPVLEAGTMKKTFIAPVIKGVTLAEWLE